MKHSQIQAMPKPVSLTQMASHKIPVFRSTGAGIAFGIGRLITVLRVAWLPSLLMLAFFGLFLTQSPNTGPRPISGNNPILLMIANIGFVAALVMFMVGMTKAYFRHDIGSLPLYFRFQSAEARMFIAYGFTYAILAIVALLVIFGQIAIGFALVQAGVVAQEELTGLIINPQTNGPSLEGNQVWLGAALLIPVFIAVSWATLRLFLVVPIVVNEGTLGIARSWRLMRGNVWRAIGVSLLTTIAGSVVLMVFTAVGYVFTALLTPDMLNDDLTKRLNEIDTEQPLTYWPALLGTVAGAAVFYAMYIGATARAYLAVTQIDDS